MPHTIHLDLLSRAIDFAAGHPAPTIAAAFAAAWVFATIAARAITPRVPRI